jgi:hypothetical protein
MNNPFAYHELHTADPSRAKDFYRKLFDWKVKDLELPFGTYSEINPGGMVAGLQNIRTPGMAAQWVTYIQVPDNAAATEKAKQLGAQPLRENVEIPEGRFSVLADPTGAVFGLWEPKEAK